MSKECTKCELHRYVSDEYLEQYHRTIQKINHVEGEAPALLVIMPAPDFEQDRRVKQFRNLMDKHYRHYDDTQIYLFHAVSCNYPKGKTLSKKWIGLCSDNLKFAIEAIKKKHNVLSALACGVDSIVALKKLGFEFSDKHKSSIMYNRRVRHTINPYGIPTFCARTFDKQTVGSYNEMVWASDLKFMCDSLEGKVKKLSYKHQLVLGSDQIKKLHRVIERKIKENGEICVSIDTETNKLSIYGRELRLKLLTVQLSFESGRAFVIPIQHKETPKFEDDLNIKFLRWFLKNPKIKKIAHNGMYDWRVFRKLGFQINGWDWDTILLHHLAYATEPHALSYITKVFTDYGDYDSELEHYKSDNPEADPGKGGTYANVPLKILAKYGAGEAVVTYDLLAILLDAVDELGLKEFYFNHVRRAQLAFLNMSHTGMNLDEDKLRSYFKEYQEELDRYYREEISQLPTVIEFEKNNEKNKEYWEFIKDRDAWWKANPRKKKPPQKKEFNPKSSDQLGVFLSEFCDLPVLLRSKGKQLPSYSKEVREHLMSLPEEKNEYGVSFRIVHILHDHLLQRHEFNTYIKGMLNSDIIGLDGRIHGNFKLFGAVTGRTSSSDPNMQNIPRKPLVEKFNIKGLFTAPKGKKIIQADYGQMELRVAASVSQDEGMLKAFNDGVDIHTLTAARLYGISTEEVTDLQRFSAKAINFGLIYGKGEAALAADYYKALDGDKEKAKEMYRKLELEGYGV